MIWQRFQEIDISLQEVGNEYTEDDYNKALLAEGPRQLARLRYVFNKSTSQFDRLGGKEAGN